MRLLAWLFPVRLPRRLFTVERPGWERRFDPFGSSVVDVPPGKVKEQPTWIMCK